MALSVADLEDRLEEAARTLRRLPDPPGSFARGYGSSWPDYVRDAGQAYGYEVARMRVIPSSQQIGEMEEAIGWLSRVDPVDAKILWMRAEGRRWQQVCRAVGMSRSTAFRRGMAALITISRRMAAADDRLAGVKAKARQKPKASEKRPVGGRKPKSGGVEP